MDPLTLSIGIGLVIGLIFVSFLGLSTGRMVVPGYFALEMAHPGILAVTIIDSLLIYMTVKLLSKVMIIYGRRRIAITVLLAFIFGILLNTFFGTYMMESALGTDLYIIGYIIPGLIALSIDRQGIIESIGSLLIAAAFIRLILIVLIGSTIVGI